MSFLAKILERLPLISSIVIVLISFIGTGMLGSFLPEAVSSYVWSFGLIALMIGLGWAREAGITQPLRGWQKGWPLYTLPFFLFALTNCIGTDWGSLTFSAGAGVSWVFDHLAIGLYEEVLLRGVVMYILYRAWGTTKAGLFAVVLGQALIFGVIHYSNLLEGAPFWAVTEQVVDATIAGVGFGGLALLLRSIWPGVFVHALVDAMGDFEVYFGSRVSDLSDLGGESLIDALYSVGSTFLILGVFGLWFTSKALPRRK